MPTDIRSFFGKPSQGSDSSPARPPAKKEVRWYTFFSGILDRIANINLDLGLDCNEKKAYELA